MPASDIVSTEQRHMADRKLQEIPDGLDTAVELKRVSFPRVTDADKAT